MVIHGRCFVGNYHRKDTISNMERKEGKLREIMGSEKGIRAVRRREVKSERQRSKIGETEVKSERQG